MFLLENFKNIYMLSKYILNWELPKKKDFLNKIKYILQNFLNIFDSLVV